VSNTPSAVDDATADCNMFLILGALRGFGAGALALRAGHWRGVTPLPLGHDPQGKTLGILGMGGIGRNVRDKARVFGMNVIYHARRRLAAEVEGGAEYVCFDELLRRSDVLSLNLPLNVSVFRVFDFPGIRGLSAAELACVLDMVSLTNFVPSRSIRGTSYRRASSRR
jgi:glyoxylate reductase